MKFFLRLKGSLELNLRNFNYSKDISDISKHPQKFYRRSLPLKILNKNGTPKKGKAYRLPFIMGFQRGCFLLRNLRLCCFLPALVRSQLEPKTPSDDAKRKTFFSPKIGWADFLGNFRLGGVGLGSTSPVLGWFGLGFPANIFWSPHFLVVWSGDDSWPEAAQCRGPRWCRANAQGCGDTRCETWEFLGAPCIPLPPTATVSPPRSLAAQNQTG